MISILTLILVYSASSVSSHLCPYPLPSHIEPCICEVDDQFRISLTCYFKDNFSSEDFDRIVSAFDYNHNIFTFKIGLHTYHNYNFYGQLNRNNVGRLNITHFIMQNLIIHGDIVQEGAFEGSYGSIETIHIYDGIRRGVGSIDLDNVLSEAGPTLKSLKLAFVNYMTSSTFSKTKALTEIVFVDSTFDHIPSNTFAGDYLPNLTSMELNKGTGHITIQANAFKGLMNLTSLKMTSLKFIGMIEKGAFNDLPKIKTIDFSRTTIYALEEDSFLNLSSLKVFDLTSVLARSLTYLPRIITNSPLLTSFIIKDSYIENIADDFFIGAPSLKTINIGKNSYLEKIVIQDLSELDTLFFSDNYRLHSITLRNLSSFKRFVPNSDWISSVSLSEMENLETVDISGNKLENISMDLMPNLQRLDLGENKDLTHSGLTTSLHGLLHPNININLDYTNIRDLDEFTFRPLIERLDGNSESSGKIDMNQVKLDCGCDVKWLVVDIARTDFFINADCTEHGMSLAEVDTLLLEMMCPPDL